MGMIATTGQLTTSEESTVDRRFLNIGQRRLGYDLVPRFDLQWHSRARKTYFPGLGIGQDVFHHPGIKFPEIKVWRIRHCHLVKRFFLSQKSRHCQVGSLVVLQKKPCDIKPGQINSILNAVVIWVTKVAIMPRFEIAIEHQI